MSDTYLNSSGTSILWEKVKQFVYENGGSGSSIPIGTIVIWSGTIENIPAGWALCDGRDGRPNLQDKFILGAGESHAIGETGGSEEVTLTVEQMPKHNHKTYTIGYSASTYSGGNRIAARSYTDSSYTVSGNSEFAGSSAPHPNMPPYYALCYIIKISGDSNKSRTIVANAPIGAVLAWSGTENDVPEGWTICNGENGTLDLRDKFILGAGESHNIGEIGGSEKVVLTAEQMPEHSHVYMRTDVNIGRIMKEDSSGTLTWWAGEHSENSSVAGGTEAHPNMPPYYTLLWIQKTSTTPTDYATVEDVSSMISSAISGAMEKVYYGA